ncbi:MAG TPA: glycosyltransferase family 4 protein [Candidatus Saccharimonadales bacterium]|nr:glycosyltransferase family 4 protein [Candidatus Saccharimonadales bacterium]
MHRVGFVFDDSLDKPDGVQQFVLIMGQWLASQGHEVHYLTGETKRTDLPNMHSLSKNVSVRFNHNRMAIPLPANRRRLKKLLRDMQFDVLHVQMPYSPFLAGRIISAADPGTAVVGTFHIAPHSELVTAANKLLGIWSKRTLKRFDAITATSAPAAAFAKQTFGIDCQVVPLPIRLDGFRNATPFDRYKEGKRVMFLGRLVERKGCQYLLQATNLIFKEGDWPKDTKLIICGSGPLEAKLKQYVRATKMDSIVEFAGQITEEDKPHYLASADVVVYPSTGGESFGVVLLEAMAACNGIVLAGNNPGYASVLADRPQQLFDPRNPADLAKRLLGALDFDDMRTKARDWQRTYVETFDVPQVGKRFYEVYNKALNERNSGT